MTNKAQPRSFEKQSKSKEDIRMLLIEHTKDPELIFTLTGKEKIDALLFHKYFPKTPIITIENDPSSFKALQKDPYPTIPFNMTVHEYAQFKYPTLHHSTIFLDYLGWFTPQKLEEIKTFISNPNLLRPDKRALLGLTFQKANREGTDVALQAVSGVFKDHETENNLDSTWAKVMQGVEEVRPNAKTIESKEYCNDGGVPMYFILLEI